MGILTRFKDIMSANIHAIADKFDNPEKDIRNYMTKLNDDLGHVSSETAALEENVRRKRRMVSDADAELQRLTRYRDRAVQEGNSGDAAIYEDRMAVKQEELKKLQDEFAVIEKQKNELSQMNEKLRSDLTVLQEKLNEIEGKMKMAEAMKKGQKQAGYDPAADMKKMEDKANAMLDRVNAEIELQGGSSSDLDDLTKKYDDMDGQE